jgi:hypothetical protein
MLLFAAAWLLGAPFVHAQTPAPISTSPDFVIEIQPTAEKGPTFTARNMSDKTITACVFQMSHSGASRPEGETVWDALSQRKPALEPGATLTQSLGHVVGQPPPDKVEVIAGAFEDGETFGDPKWVKIMLQNRAMLLSDYEQAAAFLQKGLDEHWTYDQYLTSLDRLPKQGSAYGIRRTLQANINAQQHSEVLQELVESMLDRFNRYARKIREAQIPAKLTPSQAPPQ